MTPQELKNKISETTWLLFTHPEEQREIANEIWIKFGADGIYVFINLQQ